MLIEAYNIYIFILRAHWGRNSGVMVDGGIYICMYSTVYTLLYLDIRGIGIYINI